ncbi:MAG: DivIVA domain-containing protein [Clostridia bacterium]
MLSVQSMKEKKFEKAIFGGYDISSVDNFMDEVTDEFTILQKENQALKLKLKEINDKNEEYQTVENSMRKALISAQAIANEMIEKANTERDRILNEASEIAHVQINTYRKQIAEEQRILKETQEKTSKSIAAITGFYEKQIKEVVDFSTNMPSIQDAKLNDINDFTIKLSTDKAQIAQKSDNGFTNDILEKIKRETLDPKILNAMDNAPKTAPPPKEELFNDDLFKDENQLDINATAFKAIDDQQQSMFDISELQFGSNESKQY